MTASLLEVVREARALVARAGNDFSWSSWRDSAHALQELDALAAALASGELPADRLAVVFSPTGPLQEVAEASGWGAKFLDLATRFDAALSSAEAPVRATFACSVCGKEAGVVVVDRDGDTWEARREGWPSVAILPRSSAALAPLRAALAARNVHGVFAYDFELAPFFCPTCDASYCSEHWDWWVVWDDELPWWRDSVRGRCPRGHERMLED